MTSSVLRCPVGSGEELHGKKWGREAKISSLFFFEHASSTAMERTLNPLCSPSVIVFCSFQSSRLKLLLSLDIFAFVHLSPLRRMPSCGGVLPSALKKKKTTREEEQREEEEQPLHVLANRRSWEGASGACRGRRSSSSSRSSVLVLQSPSFFFFLLFLPVCFLSVFVQSAVLLSSSDFLGISFVEILLSGEASIVSMADLSSLSLALYSPSAITRSQLTVLLRVLLFSSSSLCLFLDRNLPAACRPRSLLCVVSSSS